MQTISNNPFISLISEKCELYEAKANVCIARDIPINDTQLSPFIRLDKFSSSVFLSFVHFFFIFFLFSIRSCVCIQLMPPAAMLQVYR